MNERIEQLTRQACKELADQVNDTDIALEMFPQKFAELIVRECISALEEKIHRSIDHEGDEIWADLILKEHFGVEE